MEEHQLKLEVNFKIMMSIINIKVHGSHATMLTE